MKFTLSFKDFSWKRTGITLLIGILIIALGISIYYYFAFYLPRQEKLNELKRRNELVKDFYAKKGLPLPDYLKKELEL